MVKKREYLELGGKASPLELWMGPCLCPYCPQKDVCLCQQYSVRGGIVEEGQLREMMVQIEIDQESFQLDEEDLEQENNCGQCPVCVVRVGAYYPEG